MVHGISMDLARAMLVSNGHVMKKSLINVIFFIYVSMVLASAAKPHLTEEMSFSVSDAHLGDFPSAISTFNNNIYTVWIDPDKSTMVAKKSPDGKVSVTKIPHSETLGDVYHDSASLGIDQDGYIHITSGMHYNGSKYYQADWNYWVSSKPEDISTFEFLGGDKYQGTNNYRRPPWKCVSYANFVTDRNGQLFLCYRVKLERQIAWKGGVDAGCVARYSTKTKSWTMLGGSDFKLRGVNANHNPVKTKVLVWTDKDPEADGYEGYKPTMVVDKNNRLHFTALGQAEGNWDGVHSESISGTHAFYAYSDDSGDTWHRADGSLITSLPMTKTNGDNAAGEKGAWPKNVSCLWNQSIVGYGSDLKPIISFIYMGKKNGKTWARWDGHSWTRQRNPVDFFGHLVTDDDGVITAAAGGKLVRSVDNGKHWSTVLETVGKTGNSTALSFDSRFLYDTKQIRFQTMNIPMGKSIGTMKVYTLSYDGTSAPVISVVSTSSNEGIVGSTFNYQILASNNPTKYEASNLPPGLTIDSSRGFITGTPTTAGTYVVILKASNSSGTGTANQVLTIQANENPPIITSSANATGTVGTSFTYSITATNHPIKFLASNLPSGLSVNTTSGVISGVLKNTGIYAINLQAKNSSGQDSKTLTLTVKAAIPSTPVISSATSAVGTSGASFSYQIVASNNPDSYNASGLPSGLTINTKSGLISGIPTTPGESFITLKAINAGGTGSATLALTIYSAPQITIEPSDASVVEGQAATFKVVATGFPAPIYQWKKNGGSIIGATSASYSLDSTSQSDDGSQFTVQVSNIAGLQTSRIAKLIVTQPIPIISSALTTSGTIGEKFHYQIEASNHPTSFGAEKLPPGLTINVQTGEISGVPIASGSTQVTLSAANSGGSTQALLEIHIKDNTSEGKLISFTLINADTAQPVKTLNPGDILNLATLPTKNLNIRANTDPAKVGSVVLNLSGAETHQQVEEGAPYGLFRNDAKTYSAWTPALGKYILKATPYSKLRGEGSAGVPLEINFTVINEPIPQVTSFTLIDADKDQDIRIIKSGDTIDLSSLPTKHLNIRADVSTSKIGSIKFLLTGAQMHYHIEESMPFALFSNKGSDYESWTPIVGSYTLRATPYSEPNGGGTVEKPLDINFTITQSQP